MSYESELEYYGNQAKASQKNICLITHKDKTDDELRAILNHNAVAIYNQEGLDAYKTLGESEACSELLKQRQEKTAYRESEELGLTDALKYWEKANITRRKKAILNLPAATSYYGQLVVAILEEEELTAEEIRQWSDELTAMSDTNVILGVLVRVLEVVEQQLMRKLKVSE